MTRHGEIESIFMGLLDPMRTTNGGPLAHLSAKGERSFEQALKHLFDQPMPACLVVSGGQSPSPMRTLKAVDEEYRVLLLMAQRNLRGADQARNAVAPGDVGIYELLDRARSLLLGQIPTGCDSAIQPGPEGQAAGNATTVAWGQEWSITMYRVG